MKMIRIRVENYMNFLREGVQRLGPRRFATFLTLLTMLIADFAPSIAYKRLFGTTLARGFLDDWNFLFVDFILIPVLTYWYFDGPDVISHLWVRLENSETIKIPEDALQIAKRRISGFEFALASILICLISVWATYFANSILNPQPWWFTNRVTLVVRLATWGFSFYVGSQVLLRELITLFDLNRVIRISDVKLRPYDPDKNSGFGFVIAHVMRFTRMIALLGAVLAVWEVWLWVEGYIATGHGKVFHIGLALYILLTPIGFFVPLLGLHRAMVKAKKKLLEKMAFPLHQFLDGLLQNRTGFKPSHNAKLLQVQHLEMLYLSIDKYSTWPFRSVDLREFFVILFTGISPLLSLIPIFWK